MIDGFSSYNQIAVHPKDREKKTFTTTWGTFMYDKIPLKPNTKPFKQKLRRLNPALLPVIEKEM